MRERLIESVRDADVVIVQAPSGYGKSVFAEQLLSAGEHTVVRLRLSAPTSRAGFVESLRRGARRSGQADLAAALDQEGPIAAIDAFVELCAGRDRDLSLLVDDATHLSDRAWHLLTELVTDLDGACRCVIAHRTETRSWRGPPAHLIGPDDLSMTLGEVAAVLAQDPASSVVSDVHAVTRGWPAAVIVAAGHLAENPAWSPSPRSGGVALLAGLLADLIRLDSSTDGSRIVRLALVPLIDEPIAELVSGAGALAALERSGLPSGRSGPWIVIPDSIRDGLRSLDKSTQISAEVAALVADHYARHGELSAAVQLLGDLRLLRAMTELLAAQHWTDLQALGLAEVDVLLDLVESDSIETGDVSSNSLAELLLRARWAAEHNHPMLAATYLDRLDAIDDVSEELARAIEAEKVRALTLAMQPHEAIAAAEHLLATIPADEIVTRGRTLLASGHALAVLGNDEAHEAAIQRFEQAAQLFEMAREHRWRAEALARLGYGVLHHAGRPHAAAAALQTALSLLPAGDRTRASWLSSYADVLNTLGRDLDAVSATSEAIEIGERLHDKWVIGLALWTQAWMAGRRGDAGAVRSLLAQVEDLQPGWLSSHSGVEFYGSVADYLVALGDVAGTRYCEERALDLHRRLGYREAIDMMSARIEAHIGDPHRAIELLDAAERGSCAQPNTRWVRQLERALALRRLGDDDGAHRALDAAMASTRAMGVADLPVRFEAALLERIVEPGSGDGALARPGELVDDRVVMHLLGEFTVQRGALDVTPPDGRPSTLVKLVALHRTIMVDVVIDTLWPDADPTIGRARLRNTMNRLRSRSGDIVERVGQTLVLGARVVTDLELFDATAADAFAAPAEQRVGLARRALSGYAGPLLPGDLYADWAAAPRERLARRFVALVDIVADDATAQNNLDEAARLLDAGISADPLDEHRYARLAAVLEAQNRRSAARQVAQRAEQVFAEMGLEVGPALRRLLDPAPAPTRG